MKTDTVAIIGAAALGLFLIYRTSQKVYAVKPSLRTGTVLNQANRIGAMPSGYNYNGTTQIFNTATQGQEGYGWQYFSDGTSIGPDGRYYYQGTEVYNPAGATA